MMYIHKLLPLLLSPLVIVCALVIYGTIKRKRAVALTGIALLYLASTFLIAGPLFRWAEGNRIKPDPASLPKADAIVVLSGMLANIPTAKGMVKEWRDPDRFWGGIELYKLGKADTLIFTGGLLPWDKDRTPEGVVLKGFAAGAGVPAGNILVTGEAQNTEQEAAAVLKLIKRDKPSLLLVTSAFHMTRARLLFEKEGFVVHEYPVDFKVGASDRTPMDFLPSAHALFFTDTALREWIGTTYYRIRNLRR